MREYIERRVQRPRFAHGRSIRNAIDRARMRQASRLFDVDTPSSTKTDLMTLEAEDILQSQRVSPTTERSVDGMLVR